MGHNTQSPRRSALVLLATGAFATPLIGAGPMMHASRILTLPRSQHVRHHRPFTTPISHVVVIIQENRTVDNVFNGFPGADTAQSGYDSQGNLHQLQPISFATRCGPSHAHTGFVKEFNNGKMNGWLAEPYGCSTGASLPDGVFAYVQPSETQQYWNVAGNYGFADEVFQTNEGPSFPAHQYLIAGQAGGHGVDAPWGFAENGGGSNSSKAGVFDGDSATLGAHTCANTAGTVKQIDFTTPYPGKEGNPTVPCKDYQTIFDLGMAQGLTWKVYAHKVGNLWSAVESVQHLYNAGYSATVPETTVLTDIANHQLPNIAYVTPSPANSDHPHSGNINPLAGPHWVAKVVDAIGNDPYYWNNTTILVTWDDWGGWFDHAVYGSTMHPNASPQDPYEYGFRVPLIVISPYVNAHMVDHTQRTFDSIMSYIETTFSLGNLGFQDSPSYTDDLSDMFNYGQQPLQFVSM